MVRNEGRMKASKYKEILEEDLLKITSPSAQQCPEIKSQDNTGLAFGQVFDCP